MVAEDFLQDPQVRKWVDWIEHAWTLLSSTVCGHCGKNIRRITLQSALPNDLNLEETAESAVARNRLSDVR